MTLHLCLCINEQRRRQEQVSQSSARHARHARHHYRTPQHQLPASTAHVQRAESEGHRFDRSVEGVDLRKCLAACVNGRAGFHHLRCVNHESITNLLRESPHFSSSGVGDAGQACEMAARRRDKGVQGLKQVLHAGRQMLRAMPFRQQTIYSAIQASDGDFAHLVRSLAAASLQTIWQGHRARVKFRTLRVCDLVVRDAAKLMKSLPDHALFQLRAFLSGEQLPERELAAPDSASLEPGNGQRGDCAPALLDALSTPRAATSQLVNHVIAGAARLLSNAPHEVMGHLNLMLLRDPHAAGIFYRNLLVNGSATSIQKVFRGHRRRSALRRARTMGASPRAAFEEQDRQLRQPQLLFPLESLHLSFEEMSVENLAGSGLAGMLNILQQTLLRWRALSLTLSAEQKSQVLASLARGAGPIVAVVKHVSATSLQMAMRGHLARRRMQALRRSLLLRVGPAQGQGNIEAVFGREDWVRAGGHTQGASGDALAERRQPEVAYHPLLVTRQTSMRDRATTSQDSGPITNGESSAVVAQHELEAHERLSASVAKFVRQMKMVLDQSPQHERELLDSINRTPGPLANNLRVLSAISLQAVVRGHQTRLRLHARIKKFKKALDEVARLQSVKRAVDAQLGLAHAIRLGRYLFAFQEEKFGGTQTFYSAVCAGTGGLSEALRHACCLAIQCAVRARRARHRYFDIARAALSDEMAGARSAKFPGLRHTKARLEGGPVLDARDAPPPPPQSRRERAQERRDRQRRLRQMPAKEAPADTSSGAAGREQDQEPSALVGESGERSGSHVPPTAPKLLEEADALSEAAKEGEGQEEGGREAAAEPDEVMTTDDDSMLDMGDSDSASATGSAYSESDTPQEWSDFEVSNLPPRRPQRLLLSLPLSPSRPLAPTPYLPPSTAASKMHAHGYVS